MFHDGSRLLLIAKVLLRYIYDVKTEKSVTTFLLGLLLPILLILIHSMFRLRNLKNKVNSGFEKIGAKVSVLL